MDFNFDSEQQMLADTVGRLIEKEYGFELRQKIVASEAGLSDHYWNQFAELGLLGLTIPEAHGGFNFTPMETAIIMEAFGRGLVVEPYLPSAVLCAGLIADAGNTAQKDTLLPAIASGKTKLALAVHEPGSRYSLLSHATTASAEGDHYIVNGAKSVVIGGGFADHLIIAARTDGSADEDNGVTLFCVPRDTPGLTVKVFPNIDGTRSAEVTLENVILSGDALVGELNQGFAPLSKTVDLGIAALCNEAVGAMTRLFEMTIEHLRTRKQFGQPIGRFQALQHRAVELLTLVERSRSIALYAASRAALDDDNERRRAVSAAKAFIGKVIRQIVKESIQMHGGIGMTDELPVGHYAKRLLCIDMTLGDAPFHTARFAATTD